MAKKLFAFWSDANQYHFFALVPADMHDDDAKELAKAATSDANREDAINTQLDPLGIQGGCNDGLCVEESIKDRLAKLGFEFVDPPIGFGPWENYFQEETLLHARLRQHRIYFTLDPKTKRDLIIQTPVGDIYADLKAKTWSGQGTSGGLKTHGEVGNLISLIQLRREASSL